MDINTLKLYRKRYIPNELILLSDDELLHLDDETLITRWKPLHSTHKFSGGTSAYFFKKGWKIGKFLDFEGNTSFWYCDIVDYVLDEETNTITCEDLLFDVTVFPSGKYEVLDCDEAAQAFEKGLISREQLVHALNSLHELLEVIYHDRFDRLQAIVDEYS